MGGVGLVAENFICTIVHGEGLVANLDSGVGGAPYGKKIAEGILMIRIRSLDVDDPRAVMGVQGFEARPCHRDALVELGVPNPDGGGDLYRLPFDHDPEVGVDVQGE